MLQYRRTIQDAPNLGQAQVTHYQSGNPAMDRSSAALASGLDHIFSLGDNPLAPFKDSTTHNEAPNTPWSEGGEINDDLTRQAVEQELRRYEEDGLSNPKSLVAFWEVGLHILQSRDVLTHTDYITEA